MAAARAALGEETFATAWADGRALPLEEAIAEALAGAGDVEGPPPDQFATSAQLGLD